MAHFVFAHIIAILVVAFFVFFAASKAEGLVRIFGQVLGILLIILAALLVVALFVPGMTGFGGGYMHQRMMGTSWMHRWSVNPGNSNSDQTVSPAQSAPAPKQP